MALTRRNLLGTGIAATAALQKLPAHAAEDREMLFVGTSAAGADSGIRRIWFSARDARLSSDGLAAALPSPMNLTVDAARRRIYAGSGREDIVEGSCVVRGYAVEGDRLTPLNTMLAGGMVPILGTPFRQSRSLCIPNYGTGEIVTFDLDSEGKIANRRLHRSTNAGTLAGTGVKPHHAVLSPGGAYIIVPEIGTDRCVVWKVRPHDSGLDEHTTCQLARGAGPRHGAFHPTLPIFYCANEHGSSVSVLAWHEAGGHLQLGTTVSTLPASAERNRVSHIAVHPNGRFLYVANRGINSIASFAIDAGGQLRGTGHLPLAGRTLHFIIDRTGGYLIAADGDSGLLVLAAIDAQSGELRQADMFRIGAPSTIVSM